MLVMRKFTLLRSIYALNELLSSEPTHLKNLNRSVKDAMLTERFNLASVTILLSSRQFGPAHQEPFGLSILIFCLACGDRKSVV